MPPAKAVGERGKILPDRLKGAIAPLKSPFSENRYNYLKIMQSFKN